MNTERPADEGRDGEAREAALAASRTDRNRTLQAVHRLESALAMAAGGAGWLDEVTADLRALENAMNEEQEELNRPDSLLSMVAAENPRRFGSRVRNLRRQYDDIVRQVASLSRELTRDKRERQETADVRQRSAWVINALHHCRARQTDLVYEALTMDLGKG